MNKDNTQTKIEQAAAEAVKVVATAAKAATKLTNISNSADHDLLIKLETKMDGLKEDIRSLSDGTAKQINDHEVRINSLETEKTKTNTLLSMGIGILTLLVSLLTWHLIGR